MPSAARRFALNHPHVMDTALLTFVFACVVTASFFGTWDVREPIAWWPGLVLGVIATTALLWRRTHPRPVVVVTGVCAIAAVSLGYLTTMLLLAPVMVALFWLALLDERRTAHLFGLGVVVPMVPIAIVQAPRYASFIIVTLNPALALLLPVAWGSALRLRRAFTDSLRARAENAERTREEEALRRVAEERVRIARELHDVVAHHLTLANAQATTAAHLILSDPEQAEHLLTGLSGTTATALRELKATVGLLRRPEDTDSPLQPAPKLDQLPAMVAALATAGLTVTVTTDGATQPLSPAVDLTAYRIIQEALTNVSKHAGTPTAQVTLTYTDDVLKIEVTNKRGHPATTASMSVHSRFGLISMRERALSAGGRFTAGPRPDGGYTAIAELPLNF
ncbi:sensor histidine kinase [Streptomyces sp. NBC_01474]|uniref:sensor histidine kinase n=1 Tax=unclassified Streptomyces TaxID=2593676 RepID=UPI002DD8523B|nr:MULTISPECIES: sensor histidine kinase [unclassified Streptomyces]WSD94412.1 sensor histidine kinase [Streptomyces sp. NBC_01474]